MADEQRIAVLEQHVRSLYEQIAVLRKQLAAREPAAVGAAPLADPISPPIAESARPAAQSAPPSTETLSFAERDAEPPPPPPPPRPRAVHPSSPPLDLEKLFGRYGTIAVASLAILMGVGTFLSWAIEHGLLGPVVRVVLGFVAAAVVAGVGAWVREKRDVRFGNVLLALALAIVHLDAWAAGPRLHVLSTVVALAIAATASVALAALALTSSERTLFAIGFGGAIIAPFVTASEPGSVVVLLTYGWIVIATTIFAIRERGWEPILWLTLVAASVYVVAGIEGVPVRGASWLTTHATPLFAFACAAAALLWAREALRSKLALAFLLLVCLGSASYATRVGTVEIAITLAGTIAAYLIARELETDPFWLAIGNVVLPLGFLASTTLSAVGHRTTQAIAALALTVIAAALAWEDDEERGQHLFVTAISSGLAILVYLLDHDTRCVAALALHAALFSVIYRTTRARLLAAPIFAGLAISSLWSFILLEDRIPYQYTPFVTVASLCALTVACAWAVFAFSAKPASVDASADDKTLATIVSGLAILFAFGWIRSELAHAWSRDAAAFALIIYYALAGLALIFAGRLRHVAPWRAAGLALAFFAGYLALVETFAIDAIAMRVGARILVGVFLAAVAYWYRAPREPVASAP
jgi:uncharacterized membrane protein